MIEVLFELLDFERRTLPLFTAREYSKAVALLWP